MKIRLLSARLLHCRVLLALLLALPAAAAAQSASSPSPTASPEMALAAAEQALAAGQAGEAERLFRDLIARVPGLAEAHIGLADALVAQGRKDEAAAVLVALGDGLIGAGLYEPAEDTLRQAAGLLPETGPAAARAQAQLGRALVLNRKPVAAAEALSRAVALGEREPRTRQFLGAALWEAGRVDEAEAVYRGLVEEGAGGAIALQELGRLLLWHGRAAEAAALLRRAAEADPRSVDAWLELGRALDASGQAAEAEKAFRRAVELAPQRSDARYGLALLLARSDRPQAREEARRQLATYKTLLAEERERTRREGLERVRLERGWSLLREGKAAEAAAQFAALPEGVESLTGRAAAAATLGDHAAAAAALEKAVALAPDRGDLRLKLAEQRLLAGGSARERPR